MRPASCSAGPTPRSPRRGSDRPPRWPGCSGRWPGSSRARSARARDTAIALGLGLPVEIDDRWIEVDYGEHEGRRLTDVPADVWTRWRSDPTFRPEGGETLAEVGQRVAAACEELFETDGAGARDPDAEVVVVSHVSPIKAAVAWAVGARVSLDFRLHLSTGSLTRIGWGTTGPVLHTYNAQPVPPRVLRCLSPPGPHPIAGRRSARPRSRRRGRTERSRRGDGR